MSVAQGRDSGDTESLEHLLAYLMWPCYHVAMTQEIQELRDQIAHHETMSLHHTSIAASLRVQYATLTGSNSVDWGNGILKGRPTKSYTRWVAWLKANGPATRKTVSDAEGILTGEVPPYADTLGLSMAELVDASYPDDMMMRLSVENPQGRGRPVDVYFLWSQRFDVRPLFGVGPERPNENALTGVARPTDFNVTSIEFETDTWDEPSDKPDTVEDWLARHTVIFDQIKLGSKPDAEQRLALRSDAPEGVDVNIAIALASSGRLHELTA